MFQGICGPRLNARGGVRWAGTMTIALNELPRDAEPAERNGPSPAALTQSQTQLS